MTSLSMASLVAGEHIREVSPPRYWLFTVSRATIPNWSLIPYWVIMLLAIFVALSISFEAPVVIFPKTSFSASLPPVRVAIWVNRSSLLKRFLSASSTCIVYPRDPEVRGIMVIFVTGAEFVCFAATKACPISWKATILFSSSLNTAFFLLYPAMTVSTLSSRSSWVTASLPCLTALSAASLMILASSAPLAPLVALAMALKFMSPSIFTSLECTLSIAIRP